MASLRLASHTRRVPVNTAKHYQKNTIEGWGHTPQWQCLPSMQEVLGLIQTLHKPGKVVSVILGLRIWKVRHSRSSLALQFEKDTGNPVSVFDGGTCQGQKRGTQWCIPIIQALRSLRKTRNYSQLLSSGHSISQRGEKEWGGGWGEGE